MQHQGFAEGVFLESTGRVSGIARLAEIRFDPNSSRPIHPKHSRPADSLLRPISTSLALADGSSGRHAHHRVRAQVYQDLRAVEAGMHSLECTVPPPQWHADTGPQLQPDCPFVVREPRDCHTPALLQGFWVPVAG